MAILTQNCHNDQSASFDKNIFTVTKIIGILLNRVYQIIWLELYKFHKI